MAIDVRRKSKCALILSNGRLLYVPSKKYMLMCIFNCRCGANKNSVHRCVLLQSKNNSERQSQHAICTNLVRKDTFLCAWIGLSKETAKSVPSVLHWIPLSF